MKHELLEKYYVMDRLPHIWCPGCGHGVATAAIVEAIDNLELDPNKVCIVSGIGCSSRAPGYLKFDTLHTTHGRALAFATGIKMAKPDLHVIVISGDGDASAIGGNHLIHASRRNIGITMIVFNNNIYGMTGGQYSPTTPKNARATTAPYGNIDRNFDICELSGAAGATYTARSTVYHVKQLVKYIENGLQNDGFSLVEAVSVCPTQYGRKNKRGAAVSMFDYLKENAVTIEAAKKLSNEELFDKFIIGEFKNSPEPEYSSEYENLIKRVKSNA